jgi:hypothetical protein
MRTLGAGTALALLLCLAPGVTAVRDDKKDKDKKEDKKDDKKPKKENQPVEIPYKFTSANHIVVRAKINGKGPFNLILDTGAPAFHFTVEAAKKAKLKADDNGWANLDRFELEGGLIIKKARARVETPFQLKGMNGLGLAGMEVHGLLGYDVLSRFRMTFNFNSDKLIFTELDYKPEQPASLKGKGGGGGLGGLEIMGQAMEFAGKFLKRKTAPDVVLRGFFGMTLEEGDGHPKVASVLEKGPAGEAGLKKGDVITHVGDKEVKKVADVMTAAVKAGKVKVKIERDGKADEVTLETKEGI